MKKLLLSTSLIIIPSADILLSACIFLFSYYFAEFLTSLQPLAGECAAPQLFKAGSQWVFPSRPAMSKPNGNPLDSSGDFYHHSVLRAANEAKKCQKIPSFIFYLLYTAVYEKQV